MPLLGSLALPLLIAHSSLLAYFQMLSLLNSWIQKYCWHMRPGNKISKMNCNRKRSTGTTLKIKIQLYNCKWRGDTGISLKWLKELRCGTWMLTWVQGLPMIEENQLYIKILLLFLDALRTSHFNLIGRHVIFMIIPDCQMKRLRCK